jgi:hypothetical protein
VTGLTAYADAYPVLASWHALLHDASEAYVADVSRPLKRLPEFVPYLAAEERLQGVIESALGLRVRVDPKLVKRLDEDILHVEKAHLMQASAPWRLQPVNHPGETFRTPNGYGFGWAPQIAEDEFLALHRKYAGLLGVAAR